MKKADTDYRFKFSFVMPIYQVEEYLAETIESVVSQTMDFERNIEIILVNDGSPDDSEEVCLRYQQRFPKNIKYVKQENAGVSAARNRGLREVEGKYISLLDPDDKLSADTLERVFDFFERHYDEVDLVAIRLRFFEARTGEHMLNYKFKSSRIIDIQEEYSAIQLSSASTFIKAESLTVGYQFPSGMKYGEDARFLTELILEKMKYGVVSEPVYLYRKRHNGNSALAGSINSREWYGDTLQELHYHLISLAKAKFGTIPKYIQYLMMYEMQWRFKQAVQHVLSEGEEEEYRQSLYNILTFIDDDIIISQKHLSIDHKLFLLSKKYGKPVNHKIKQKGFQLYYDKYPLYNLKTGRQSANIEILENIDDHLVIEGYFRGVSFPGSKVVFKTGGQEYVAEIVDRPLKYVRFLGEVVYKSICFKAKVPMTDGLPIVVYLEMGGEKVKLPLITHKHARISQTTGRAYRTYGKHIIIRRPYSLVVEKYTVLRRIIRELKYDAALAQSAKWYGLTMRIAYFLMRPFIRKDVWLISDRVVAAGDNGEALFKYITDHGNAHAKPYFAISKKSDDFKRMKRYGKVVDRESFYYKLLFLNASKIISSHADDFVINAFEERENDLKDLFVFDFVFLQHGITKDDISKWLNKYDKNIKLFVTAARPEYESLLSGTYNYDKNVVKLTGFPRYDYLQNDPKNKLILAPTWRRNLTTAADKQTGKRSHDGAFKNTAYFKFYSGLMNDPRIQTALREKGMTGELYLHPALASQAQDFQESDVFTVKDMPYDYKVAFSEGSVLVTDFSSVAFDFAYLKKPVIYTQFDRETFYKGHLYSEGYFSYEKDGFGPVAYNYESAVKEIVAIIGADCQMPQKYIRRVAAFFYKFDSNNSKRVYDAIKKIS